MASNIAYSALSCIRVVGQRVFTCRANFLAKTEIFAIFVAAFQPWTPIGVKFCTANRTHVPLGGAKFHMNRCNKSPLLGENADFRPVSKFKYRLTPLRGKYRAFSNAKFS